MRLFAQNPGAGRRRLSAWLLAVVLAGASPLAGAGAYEEFFDAIQRDEGGKVQTLILRGINTNSADRKLGPAIVLAAREKAWSALKALLLSPATDVNVRNANGETALMYASLNGELEIARLLVSRGAQVNHPGWTPLHYAASAGQLSVVQWLLEQSAYIDAASENGTTPLMLAARQKHTTVAQALVKEGADPSLRNQAGLTAADYFARNGEPEQADWMRARADDFTRKYGTREQPVPARR